MSFALHLRARWPQAAVLAVFRLAFVAAFVAIAASPMFSAAVAKSAGATAPRPEPAPAPMPALVFDLNTGQVLLQHDAGQPWRPASLTKLMTAWLVMREVDAGRLSFDSVFTITPSVVAGVEKGAAKYGAKVGDRMTIGRMLSFLMVRSDADMALALAEAVAGDVDSFVRRMNRTAAALGMSGTHFANPHGMHHPAQVTTARDMALLARDIYRRYLRRHPDWWRFFSLRRIGKTVHDKQGKPRLVQLKNRNHLLFMMPEANGMKTGFVCTSGFNLLATARRGKVLLGVVVFGRRSAYNRASVARILLEEGFRRKRAGEGLRMVISRLPNRADHAPDMTASICRGRVLPKVDPARVAGWGVIIGPFRSALRATAGVEAELLAADLAHLGTARYGMTWLSGEVMRKAGVAEDFRRRMAEWPKRARRKAPTGGVVWNLNEAQAVELCRRARAHKVGCGIVSPADMAELRALLPQPQAQAKGKVAVEKKAVKPRKVHNLNIKVRKPAPAPARRVGG